MIKYHKIEVFGLKRKLPIVSLGPKIKIASFNLLGDTELVSKAAKEMAEKCKEYDADYLVGPEVKVLPVIQEMAKILNHDRYIICRKGIKGYMIKPLVSGHRPSLTISRDDVERIKGKKVILVDDVVSTGRTLQALKGLMNKANAEVVASIAIFKQGQKNEIDVDNFTHFYELPLF